MNTAEMIAARLADLIQTGERVLASRRPPPAGIISADFRVDGQLAAQWATSAQSLLARAFGDTSVHYQNFTRSLGEYIGYSEAVLALGVLRAASDDWAGGHLAEVRRLVEADVFDDFLEQAEHLRTNGYHQAGAVVAGCVLEDRLRSLCVKHGVPVVGRPKLDSMNAELARVGAYDKLVQKRITLLADLRNKAAHGEWGAFGESDVDDMLRQVRRFVTDYGV